MHRSNLLLVFLFDRVNLIVCFSHFCSLHNKVNFFFSLNVYFPIFPLNYLYLFVILYNILQILAFCSFRLCIHLINDLLLWSSSDSSFDRYNFFDHVVYFMVSSEILIFMRLLKTPADSWLFSSCLCVSIDKPVSVSPANPLNFRFLSITFLSD